MTTTSGDRLGGLSAEKQAALAKLLAQRAKPAGPEPIARLPRDGGPLPCSFEQRRMWTATRLDPDRVVNVTAARRLTGPLDVAALRAAVADLVARHEILRTVYVEIDGEPYQRILSHAQTSLKAVDLPDGQAPSTEADPSHAQTSLKVEDLPDGQAPPTEADPSHAQTSLKAEDLPDGQAPPTEADPSHAQTSLREVDLPDGRAPSMEPDLSDAQTSLRVVDLSGVPINEREARAEALAVAAENERLDPAAGPVFRATLLRLADNEHRLVLVWHHIASDGLSAGTALNEIIRGYRARLTGAEPPAPPGLQYADYAAWSRARLTGAVRAERLAYWRDRLATGRAELPHGRPAGTGAGETAVHVSAGLTQRLQRAGGPATTPYLAFLTAYKTLLMRYTGQPEVTVGSLTGGRGRRELEPLIGCFINVLVLHAELPGELRFAEAVARVRKTMAGALAHELPFDELVAQHAAGRALRSAPLFESAVVVQRAYPEDEEWPDLESAVWGRPLEDTTFDMALLVREQREGGYDLVFRYRRDRFADDAVERLAGHYATLLESIAAAPDQRLFALDLLTEAERERTLRKWNETTPPRPPWRLLHEVIDAQVAADPQAPAVVQGSVALRYGELDQRARQLAGRLRSAGVRPDQAVGICLAQSPELAVAVLGVLRAGGGYLPLDPELPDDRLGFCLADSGATVLLTTSDLLDRFGGYPGQVLCLDEPADESQEEPAADGPHALPENLAYLIYTSGSTGRPKGVAIQHRQVLNYLAGVRERFAVEPGSAFGLIQSLAFDFGVTTFYLALATGGCVHLLPKRSSGAELAGYLAETGIDYLKMTPSHLAALADEVGIASLLPRRALVLGGEASRTDWARELARTGSCAVFNHYGPTEATVGVTTWAVRADNGDEHAGTVSPIGRPLPGARAHVLDRYMRPVPPGVPGELYLGGDRLARGYLGRPGLTAERFVADPFGEPGTRLYRTGDLARRLPDGTLEFLGRRDHQVKIRGYRVELGEIEAALGECAGVVQAVVVVRDDRLVAYLERAGEDAGDSAALRAELGRVLPDYMVPTRYVWLDKFPLQAHGKVDRARLPEPAAGQHAEEHVPPDGAVEGAIAGVWAQVLGVPRVGALDDFFELGGHSLLAMRTAARLRRALPDGCRPVGIADIFEHRTVRELASFATASEGAAEAGGRLLRELTPPVPGVPELSLVCVPYGAASAVVYQPLADALPGSCALFAVERPGTDVGLGERTRPLAEIADGCVAEILARVTGPLVLYGHCGPGGALAVEIARRLQAAGRTLTALYLGGIFPFARPSGRVLGPLYRRLRPERLRADTVYATWLQSIGAEVGGLDAAERKFMIRTMREDGERAEEYFTRLLDEGAEPLDVPVISVVGERDPGTEYYRERYREWGFLSSRTALVILDEAGHYFLKYRAAELAEIVTTTHLAVHAEPEERAPDATWWLDQVSTTGSGSEPGTGRKTAPPPSMGRFLAVAAGQLASMTGTALTEFALPLWVYQRTGSLLQFTMFAVVALVPGLLASPAAGAIVDRTGKRGLLLASGVAAGGVQGLVLLLLLAGQLRVGLLYPLLALLSVALTFQRLAYNAAVPQLIPKAYLGHANGVVQFTMGVARFVVPVAAVGLLAGIGLKGILLLDVISYVVALGILLAVRFPKTMAWQARETLTQEIRNGFHYLWRRRGLRAMVLYFFVLNIFLSTVFVLISPLALAVGTLADAGRIAMVSGLGFTLGGLAMALWGGPRHRRMTALLYGCLLLACCAAVAGSRPSLAVIAAGVFGMSLLMALVEGTWLTIIHTKTPHRFHARVIAVNQALAMSTQPLGFALVAPLAPQLLDPLLRPDGALAGSAGALLGVGEHRGLGLLYVLCGVVMAGWTVLALARPALAHFDRDTPDAEPDDVVGLRALESR